jgi:hypothetical protein
VAVVRCRQLTQPNLNLFAASKIMKTPNLTNRALTFCCALIGICSPGMAQIVADIGPNPPTPGLNDLTNFYTPNPAFGTDEKPGGMNYYDDNGAGLVSPGQTFLSETNGVLTSVALQMGNNAGTYSGNGSGTARASKIAGLPVGRTREHDCHVSGRVPQRPEVPVYHVGLASMDWHRGTGHQWGDIWLHDIFGVVRRFRAGSRLPDVLQGVLHPWESLYQRLNLSYPGRRRSEFRYVQQHR